ncbi:DUF2332 domain-containing protein [Streptomyces sp. 4N509B]|uniref:DUF2332 domain-containing protein n=1 Tax=Streptomyces sp. 4N509B TaxID=3457413 RepID=UPI003FCF156D
MRGENAARLCEQQAEACGRLGSPLYAALLTRVAQDVRDGGPCGVTLAEYEDATLEDAVPLRLLGAVHALALTGRAPALAAHYPSAGGTAEPEDHDAVWSAFREAVAGHREWVARWLRRPPQTNEVGRANLLLAALLHTVPEPQWPVRLLELGASAGLNLRVEQFRYEADGFSWGSPDSPVRLADAWRGGVPGWLREGAARHPSLRIVERRGCDVTPIDPLSPDGSLALRAYLWPDQLERTARLEGALRLATKVPATVETAGAAEFLAGVELQPGTLTVVWHSVMRQYVPAAEWEGVERELTRLAASAGPDAGFAHASFEPGRVAGASGFWLTVRQAGRPERVLASARPHGLPARGHHAEAGARS